MPFRGLEVQVLEDAPGHTRYRDQSSRVVELHKRTGVLVNERYSVDRPEDWFELEELARKKKPTTMTPTSSRWSMALCETDKPG